MRIDGKFLIKYSATSGGDTSNRHGSSPCQTAPLNRCHTSLNPSATSINSARLGISSRAPNCLLGATRRISSKICRRHRSPPRNQRHQQSHCHPPRLRGLTDSTMRRATAKNTGPAFHDPTITFHPFFDHRADDNVSVTCEKICAPSLHSAPLLYLP